MENKKLIAIGEALIDFIPDKTGCKFSEVTAFSPKVGGAPANVCGAFTKLGGSSALITQLGDDPFGHKIADELAFYDIDTSTVSFTDKASTALAFVSLENDGNRTFSFYRKPSADMLLTPEQLKGEWFENGYALHFCSVSLGDFPMKDAHLRAIELARKNEMLISFDPNLLAKGVKLVIYTCGKDGAYAYTETAKAFSPALSVKAVDTTGAGDGFIGSFLRKLQSLGTDVHNISHTDENTLKECLDLSNKFCAVSVQSEGAIASYPTKI